MQQILWRFMGQTPTTRDDKPLAARDPQGVRTSGAKKRGNSVDVDEGSLGPPTGPMEEMKVLKTPIYPIGSMGFVY